MISAHKQRIVTTLALTCAFALSAAVSASADTWTVDTASDNGSLNGCTGAAADCSLRGALGLVNSGSGGDIVRFNSGLTITIDSELPALAKSTLIESVPRDTVVRGSGTYAGACTSDDWAFDITGAVVTMRGLSIYDVCGRAVRSNVPAPTFRVGPRRANGTVSIAGNVADGVVDLFRADAPASGLESLSFLASTPVAGGGFSYLPASEPAPGDSFAAQAATAGGSSGLSRTTTPADLTSPVPTSAVAVNNNTLRVDFNETLGAGSLSAATAGVTIAGLARGIVGASSVGNSVYLVSNFPWGTGETGSVTFSGTNPVIDAAGNEVVGQPSAFVAAGPGELSAPVISRYKVSPRGLCIRYSSKCKRKEVAVTFTLNKAARVVFEVYRGKKFVVKFIRNAPAGANKVRIFSMMNGRTLPISKALVLRATPQDLARNPGAAVQARFRGVKNRKDY